MESLEESSKLMEAEHARTAKEKSRIDAIKKELEKEVARCEEDLKKLKEDRKKLTDRIDPELFNLYMNLLKTTQGIAVVEAKNEVCMGCDIHIPPQLFVEIKSNDAIITCPQCRRILYYVRPETDSRISVENNA
jgi:predicted  nucleic acid-binding Zn-ribbon protein